MIVECIHCRSTNLHLLTYDINVAADISIDIKRVWIECACNDCKKNFVVVYQLTPVVANA